MNFHAFFHCQISIYTGCDCDYLRAKAKYTHVYTKCNAMTHTGILLIWYSTSFVFRESRYLLHWSAWEVATTYIETYQIQLKCNWKSHALYILSLDLPGSYQETLLPLCLKSITAQQQLPSSTWRGSETPMCVMWSLHPWLLYSIDLLVYWNVTWALDKHRSSWLLLSRKVAIPSPSPSSDHNGRI